MASQYRSAQRMDSSYARRVERIAMHAPYFRLCGLLALLYARSNFAAYARDHFARGLFRKRHCDDVRDAPRRVFFEQTEESLDQNTSLSRPRARRHYHAQPSRLYRFAL